MVHSVQAAPAQRNQFPFSSDYTNRLDPSIASWVHSTNDMDQQYLNVSYKPTNTSVSYCHHENNWVRINTVIYS